MCEMYCIWLCFGIWFHWGSGRLAGFVYRGRERPRTDSKIQSTNLRESCLANGNPQDFIWKSALPAMQRETDNNWRWMRRLECLFCVKSNKKKQTTARHVDLHMHFPESSKRRRVLVIAWRQSPAYHEQLGWDKLNDNPVDSSINWKQFKCICLWIAYAIAWPLEPCSWGHGCGATRSGELM